MATLFTSIFTERRRLLGPEVDPATVLGAQAVKEGLRTLRTNWAREAPEVAASKADENYKNKNGKTLSADQRSRRQRSRWQSYLHQTFGGQLFVSLMLHLGEAAMDQSIGDILAEDNMAVRQQHLARLAEAAADQEAEAVLCSRRRDRRQVAAPTTGTTCTHQPGQRAQPQRVSNRDLAICETARGLRQKRKYYENLLRREEGPPGLAAAEGPGVAGPGWSAAASGGAAASAGGSWQGGEWQEQGGGDWQGGEWQGGEWQGGEWQGGDWRAGTWEGSWKRGPEGSWKRGSRKRGPPTWTEYYLGRARSGKLQAAAEAATEAAQEAAPPERHARARRTCSSPKARNRHERAHMARTCSGETNAVARRSCGANVRMPRTHGRERA